MELSEVRKLFPVFEERNYMFTGGIAPANTHAIKALQANIYDFTYNTSHYYRNANNIINEVKNLFAELMHCDSDEVAITANTSEAINIPTDLLKNAKTGGNVVVDEFTYPSSIYPWLLLKNKGIKVRTVKQKQGLIDIKDIEQAVDDKTIAISVCHVSPFEGFRHDVNKLSEIAHANNAVLIVDGAQGAGAADINLHESGVDFYGCCAMKWLLGAPGAGFLYIAKKHLNKIPSRAGYVSGGPDIKNFKFDSTAARFELGKPGLLSLAHTKPGLEILLELGMKNVQKHILDISGRLISALKTYGINVVTPEDPGKRMGIIAIHSNEAHKIFKIMHDYKIDIYSNNKILPYYKGGLVQISTHIYNNYEDIDSFMKTIDIYSSQNKKSNK